MSSFHDAALFSAPGFGDRSASPRDDSLVLHYDGLASRWTTLRRLRRICHRQLNLLQENLLQSQLTHVFLSCVHVCYSTLRDRQALLMYVFVLFIMEGNVLVACRGGETSAQDMGKVPWHALQLCTFNEVV